MTTMSVLHDIELSILRSEEIVPAVSLAARGMLDNPSSVVLFGDDPVRRVRALEPTYHWVLSSLERPSLVARRRGILVGIAALAPPDRCFFRQMAGRQRTMQVGRTRLGVSIPRVPRQLLVPLLSLGPSRLARLSTWGEEGFKHDPRERHQHVELVVVEGALQGLGIGRFMMEELCRQMDEIGERSYLETDKQENVRFYQHFGFQVTGEARVLGIPVWYMERPPSQ